MGSMARRDIHIRADDQAETYELELLAGGAARGSPWRRVYGTLAEAEEEAARHMHHPEDDWRDITGAHRPAAGR